MVVPLPPRAEQERIEEELGLVESFFDGVCSSAYQTLQCCTALRQSILKAAFAGKLVPQDPNDEPASVLLARIRAERAAAPKPARGRRRKAGPQQLELLD
jgi:type I restriction enzyme S subunit